MSWPGPKVGPFKTRLNVARFSPQSHCSFYLLLLHRIGDTQPAMIVDEAYEKALKACLFLPLLDLGIGGRTWKWADLLSVRSLVYHLLLIIPFLIQFIQLSRRGLSVVHFVELLLLLLLTCEVDMIPHHVPYVTHSEQHEHVQRKLGINTGDVNNIKIINYM